MRNLPGGRGLAILVVFVLVAAALAVRNGFPWQAAGSPGESGLPSPTAGDSPGAAASPGIGTPGPSAIDTADWQLVRVHSLGFSIELPPTFELVSGDDPTKPVPSIDSIAAVAAPIADGLKQQASILSTAPGVFGELGLWSVEPDSLAQVGLLAGQPYRVADADLQGIVQSAVAGRETPLEGSTIDQVELPSGTGYLAEYRDAVDLGAHLEIHLRTPTGRYLVLVMALIAPTVDPASDGRFLAIAGSLAPLAGADSGDVPAPPATADGHADPGLEADLPTAVGGVALQVRSLNGEDLVGGDLGTGTVLDAVGSLVATPGRVTVALGVPASGTSDLVLTAFHLDGVDPAAIQARLAQFPPQIWKQASVGGRAVLESVAGTDGRKTYLRVSGSVIEEIVTSDAKLAGQAIAGLG